MTIEEKQFLMALVYVLMWQQTQHTTLLQYLSGAGIVNDKELQAFRQQQYPAQWKASAKLTLTNLRAFQEMQRKEFPGGAPDESLETLLQRIEWPLSFGEDPEE